MSFSGCLRVSQLLVLSMTAVLMDGQLSYASFPHTVMARTVAVSVDCTSVHRTVNLHSHAVTLSNSIQTHRTVLPMAQCRQELCVVFGESKRRGQS